MIEPPSILLPQVKRKPRQGRKGSEEKSVDNPYNSPACDIVTTVGASSGIYSNLPKVTHPIISTHYGDIYFKYGKTIGKIGIIGDLVSTIKEGKKSNARILCACNRRHLLVESC